MTDELTVREQELSAHAETLDAIGEAVAAARTEAYGREVVAVATRVGQGAGAEAWAYGRLCALVPAMLGELQSALTGALTSAADSLADTADRLRATAEAYQSTDRRRAEAFDDLRR